MASGEQRTIILNRGGDTTLKERLGRVSKKTGKRGKARRTLEISTDPIVCGYGRLPNLMQGIAAAAVEVIKRRLEEGRIKVAPSTFAKRGVEARAFQRGEKWAQKRNKKRGGYSAPREVWDAWHSSGLFRDSLVARYVEKAGGAVINFAASRLDPATFPQGFQHAIDLLIRVVPELGDASAMGRTREVAEASKAANDQLVTKARESFARGRMTNVDRNVRLIRNIREVASLGLEFVG